MKKFLLLSLVCGSVLSTSCEQAADKKQAAQCCSEKSDKANTPYQKKYTNADFYKDGKLQPEVAKAAYLDMLDHYNIPYTKYLADNMFITDFNLGDMENVGMAGVFWINNQEAGYFGHEIFLLPNQMIVEHKHVPTEVRAKMESWQVRNGWAYNFGTGAETPNNPAHPESQKGHITVKNCSILREGEIASLNTIEHPHFLRGGDEGVVITEYGTFHDGNGLRFTNPKVEFIDCLQK